MKTLPTWVRVAGGLAIAGVGCYLGWISGPFRIGIDTLTIITALLVVFWQEEDEDGVEA